MDVQRSTAFQISKQRCDRSSTMWWPIAYHPILRRAGLNRIFQSFMQDWEHILSNLARSQPGLSFSDIRVAWRNGAPHLVHWLR
eukprot:2305878-Karenia_brevis.AAC.1